MLKQVLSSTRMLTAAAIVAVLMATNPAQAVVVDTSGTWDNVQVSGNPATLFLSGAGTDTIFWGSNSGGTGPASPQSSYNFAGVSSLDIGALPSNIGDMVTFDLGTFTHDNQTIFLTSISGAELTVNLSITNGSILNENFAFPFLHNETTNDANGGGIDPTVPCPNGGFEPCPDVVMVNPDAPDQTFELNEMLFLLEILGFVEDGGSLVTEFLTLEANTNVATLRGKITKIRFSEPSEVPEPATLTLMGLGLVGLGVVARRRKRTA